MTDYTKTALENNKIQIEPNMRNGDIHKCDHTFVFMIDIRNSTSLNQTIEDDKELANIWIFYQ